MIYVFAPANYASGGPEALHQLAHSLQKNGFNVCMYYYEYNKNLHKTPRHKNYDIYNIPYIENIENIENIPENYIIIPEAVCNEINNRKLNKLKKIVWWLSVDFFFKSKEIYDLLIKKKKSKIKNLFKSYPVFPNIEDMKKEDIIHIPNSYYTEDFLTKNKLKHTSVISDYLNNVYTQKNLKDLNPKENIIIFNPVKNGEFLSKIIEKTPNLKWIAIQNMTPNQVKELMNKAKLYIDFGFHPGRERMPREACLSKCCLIIGKEGSAKFKEDMPILDDFHFENKDENIEKIIEKIIDCLDNYEKNIPHFKNYEESILDAENRFNNEVRSVFTKEIKI